MASNHFIKILRNKTLFADHDAAITSIETQLASLSDGEICIATYGADMTSAKTLLCVVRVDSSGNKGYEIFDNEGQATAITNAINALDVTSIGGSGKVITTISQTDGKISATATDLKAANVAATAITASTTTVGVTGTNVESQIKSLAQSIKSTSNAAATYSVKKVTTGLATNVKEAYQLVQNVNGTTTDIDVQIPIYKDSSLVSVSYSADTQKLTYVYIDVNGATQTVDVDMGKLITEAEFGNGMQVVNGVASVKVDSSTNGNEFLSVSANGVKVSGVSTAITNAINALDVTDTASAGKYVSAVSETNGKISVSRANVADAVLNGFVNDGTTGAIAATDTVNGAIEKLENKIASTGAAATTKVAEGTDSGNNLSIATSTGTDGSKTYTINLSDVASATALTSEIAARKAVDGQTGSTYSKNTSANYISAATSLNDADVKLDAALKTANTNISANASNISAEVTRAKAEEAKMLTGVAAGNGVAVTSKASYSQTISVKLNTTAGDNALSLDANGLYLSSIIECGEY